MKQGGGQAKGAAFERTIAQDLSLWISGGQRKDLLRRNILSGGRFTTGAAKGELHGVPGDLSISHPLAAAFCSTFLVECKHYAKLDWDTFLYNPGKRNTSFFHRVIALCREQAELAGLHWMIVAKQNKREPYVIMEYEAGMAACANAAPELDYHLLQSGEYFVTPFAPLLASVDPAALCISLAKQ